MTRKIKVTETRVHYYVPDLKDQGYADPDPLEDGTTREPATNIEEALAIDKQDVERGQIEADELSEDFPDVTFTWEVVDVNE